MLGGCARHVFWENPAYELAKAIIVLGCRTITADTALRLARYFGTTPEFWIKLQARYDLELAKDTVGGRIEKEVSPRAA